jgi:hypothetical protein
VKSKTPILDREQPPPMATSKKWFRWLPVLVGAVIGGLLGFLEFDLHKLWAFVPGKALLVGFIPAFYLGVLLHELGHLVAGLSAGFELRALMVGGVLLTREAQGWKVRFSPRSIVVGGLTSMVPESADRLVDRYIRLVLGGPAASVVLLAITVILALIFPGSAGVRVLLLVNLLLVISACLPYTWRSQPSDGKGLLLLIGKGPAAERLTALLYLLALDTQQVEPRDWPRALVEKVSIPTKDKSFLMNAISVSYADALDSGDAERIAEAIEHALSVNAETRPDVRRAFYVAASCFQGIFRKNVALAEAWLESARKVKGAISQQDWDSKASASIALAKGERAQAREWLTRYLALLDGRPASGLLAAERARTVDLLRGSPGEGLLTREHRPLESLPPTPEHPAGV